MKILVTGASGFIGYHLVKKLVKDGHQVIGLDNINDYYSIDLKYDRLKQLGIAREEIIDLKPTKSSTIDGFSFIKADITNGSFLTNLFDEEDFHAVCNLAAQAGVRYSLENPRAYTASNIEGFLNILESCRKMREDNRSFNNLVYASSSSVYGLNESVPFKETDNIDHPVSLYAATKKSNELMAHSYSHLYGIPVTGLRFFTVYGPWGRPDMAPMLFSRAIMDGKPIKVFNNGDMARDFTYIGDIVEGIAGALYKPAMGNSEWSGLNPDPSSSISPFRVYNIGNGNPVKLMNFISILEKALGKKAEKIFMPMQPGDVKITWADTTNLENEIKYKPSISLEEGIKKFAEWYLSYQIK